MLSRTLLACATFVVAAVAQTSQMIAFTNPPANITAGQPVDLTWAGGDGSVSSTHSNPISKQHSRKNQTKTNKHPTTARNTHPPTRSPQRSPNRPTNHRLRHRHLLHLDRPQLPPRRQQLRLQDPTRRQPSQLHRPDHPHRRRNQRPHSRRLRPRFLLIYIHQRKRQRYLHRRHKPRFWRRCRRRL